MPEITKKPSEFPNPSESEGLTAFSKLASCNPEKFGDEIELEDFKLYNACLRVQ